MTHRPQLIGNARHISGTYSIISQEWHGDKKELHGESAVVAGVPYTLWFFVPTGYEQSSLQITSKSGRAIKGEWNQQGETASLTFTGDDAPARWQIQFK
jgi:hypothetical protein